MSRDTKTQDPLSEGEIVRQRDEAVRRALNTPPKHHKDMKLGKRKPKASAPSSSKR